MGLIADLSIPNKYLNIKIKDIPLTYDYECDIIITESDTIVIEDNDYFYG